MKVKEVIKEEKPEFKPFTIEITIESEDELRDLWHKLILDMSDESEYEADEDEVDFPNSNYTYSLWDKVDDKLIALNMKK